MARAIGRLLVTAAMLAAVAPLLGVPAGGLSPGRPFGVTDVVPPLADPALVPGISRCTSDGACTVTDASGTRPGTPFEYAP